MTLYNIMLIDLMENAYMLVVNMQWLKRKKNHLSLFDPEDPWEVCAKKHLLLFSWHLFFDLSLFLW